MERRICKKCLLESELPADIVDYLERGISNIPKELRTKDEEFRKRINVCRSCDYLSGATCNACGCYVELRAAVARQKCPYKKWVWKG